MFEDLYGCLIEKYGDEFNWHPVNEANISLIKELRSELNPNHPLYDKAILAAAKCSARDDVLFLLSEGKYAIVHLTYSTNNTEGFPRYKEFPNIQDAIKYIEEQFIYE